MANETERRVLRVLEHIHANPTADLSLDALAEIAALNRFHWRRLFRAVTGETAAQTVRRMHRAAVASVSSREPLAGVAASVGYPDVTGFARGVLRQLRHAAGGLSQPGQPASRPVALTHKERR